jgi:hypothetical protein
MIIVKLIDNIYKANGSRDSAVGVTNIYGVKFPVGTKFFFSPRLPDWLWSRPSFESNEYRGFSPRSKAAGA